MKDEKLLKISLITTIIGLFALFIISQYQEDEVYRIDEIDKLEDNEKLVTYGKVENIKESEKALNIDITEMKKIRQKAVMFKDSNKSSGVSNGDYIKIKGEKYNGKVIVEDIEVING